MNRAFELAHKALHLGDPPRAYRLLAQMYLFVPWDGERDYDKAVAAARTAVRLNPNDADNLADLAEVLVFFGEPGEAIELIKRAKRLNPNFVDWLMGLPVGMTSVYARIGSDWREMVLYHFRRLMHLRTSMGT